MVFQHGARIKENPTAKVTEVPKGDNRSRESMLKELMT